MYIQITQPDFQRKMILQQSIPTPAPLVYYVTDRTPNVSPSPSDDPSPIQPDYFKNERRTTRFSDCPTAAHPPAMTLDTDGCYMSYGTVDGSGNAHNASTFDDFATSFGAARKAVIFIPGFNEGFAGALSDARRLAAQLAAASGAASVPVIIYSWPTKAADYPMGFDLLEYPDDETNNLWTMLHFRNFLVGLLSKDTALCPSFVAHSLGNRAMLDGLLALRDDTIAREGHLATPAGSSASPCPPSSGAGDFYGRVQHVISIEPDVDTQTFAEDVWQLSDFVRDVTVYGTTDDVALEGSRSLHKHCRAGRFDCEPMFVQMPGVSNCYTVASHL